MTETLARNDLQDASFVNPFEIGRKVGVIDSHKKASVPEKLKRLLPFSDSIKQNITENEIEDLLKIDPGEVSLDDIREYATSHVIYYESM